MKQLQTGNAHQLYIYKTIKYDEHRKLEQFLHGMLKHCHIRGEWFRMSKEKIKEIVGFMTSTETSENSLSGTN